MKQAHKFLASIVLISILTASCTSINRSIREPETRLNLTKSDFTLSDQKSAEAQSTKIIGIDFERLFLSKSGSIGEVSLADIPVIGGVISDKTQGYALYELMNNNPGYDIVLYPQFETKVVKPFLGIGFLTTKTTVKATARLGKLNP